MHRITACLALLALIIGLGCASASADSLQLRDGRHFDGRYVGGTESMVAFFTEGTVAYFPVANVLLVVFGQAGTPGSLASPSGLSSPALKPMGSLKQQNKFHPRKAANRETKHSNPPLFHRSEAL